MAENEDFFPLKIRARQQKSRSSDRLTIHGDGKTFPNETSGAGKSALPPSPRGEKVAAAGWG